MKINFIKDRISDLNSNRIVGPEGLSSKAVRTSEIKQRFTDDEGKFIGVIAHSMGVTRAVLSNALFIDAVIDLLAGDAELCDEVMSKWQRSGGEKIDFFDEIYARSEQEEPIEGQCAIVAPALLRITARKGS